MPVPCVPTMSPLWTWGLTLCHATATSGALPGGTRLLFFASEETPICLCSDSPGCRQCWLTGCHLPQASSAPTPRATACCHHVLPSPGCVPTRVTAQGGLASPPRRCGLKHLQGDPSPASHHRCWAMGAIPTEPCRAEIHCPPPVREAFWPKPILLQRTEWKRGEPITVV